MPVGPVKPLQRCKAAAGASLRMDSSGRTLRPKSAAKVSAKIVQNYYRILQWRTSPAALDHGVIDRFLVCLAHRRLHEPPDLRSRSIISHQQPVAFATTLQTSWPATVPAVLTEPWDVGLASLVTRQIPERFGQVAIFQEAPARVQVLFISRSFSAAIQS